jgi:pimeloyl-ACP methyl ester carboxylesterase
MQLPAFSTDLRCITYDAAGTGEASAPITRTSIGEMSQEPLALLDKLELQQVHLAGWSMGAAVATAAALEARDRVRSLSLYTPWGRTDRWLSLGFRYLAHVARHGTLADYESAVTWLLLSRDFVNSIDAFDDAMAATAASAWYPHATTLIAQLEASVEHDMLDGAAAISCPTLVVAGERDQLVPAVYAAELAAAIPGARLEILQGPGSTHGLPVERATEFNDLALNFLKEVDGDV